MTLNPKELITVTELARLRGVCRKTVYNWLKAGTAPRHECIGGRYYFYFTDVESRSGGTAP